MTTYNEAFRVLYETVTRMKKHHKCINRIENATMTIHLGVTCDGLTPEQVTECCDTIIRAATIMSREVDKHHGKEIRAFRLDQSVTDHADA